MLSSIFTLVALSALSRGTSISRRQTTNASYHYVPVEFEYGANSRVTANLTYGTAANASLVKTVIDSGSANFWVWEAGAIVHWGSQYLGVEGPCNETVGSYNPALSSTASVANHSSSYSYAGNAKIVTGKEYANDTIAVVGGGSIPNVQFAMEDYGLIRQLDDGTCPTLDVDLAILGLSPYVNTTAGPSFRQNLYEAGLVASKTMFMWFNSHHGALETLTGGLLFGAVDTSKYEGDLVRVPNVVGDFQIGVYVARPHVTVNGKIFYPDSDENCLVDSGAHADSIPFAYSGTEQGRFFNSTASVGIVEYNGVVAYNGTCESIPHSLNISYTFAGSSNETITIDVPVRNYARGFKAPDTPEGICVLNLEVGGCVFGAPFLSAAVLAMDDEDNTLAFGRGAVSAKGSDVDESSLKVFAPGESF